MIEPHRILIVDDESRSTRRLRATLSFRGYTVRDVNHGVAALVMMKSWLPSLIITDVSVDQLKGTKLCRDLRSQSEAPIIVLSAEKEESIKVKILDSGADDYVTKPFSMNELLARVRAKLRRVPRQHRVALIETGDLRIDVERHSVTVRGNEVHLTPTEFQLLTCLAQHPGKVLTHRALLHAVWGGQSVYQPESLRVFVGHLRKKIAAPGARHHILTEPWVGYRLDSDVLNHQSGRFHPAANLQAHVAP